MNERAVVLVSGGMDSATVLALAAAEFTCVALSIDYGQRHRVELRAAKKICTRFAVGDHRIVKVDLRGIGGSSLTDNAQSVPVTATAGIPNTYVPARNTVFLALALGLAEVVDAGHIFIGANAVDFSGYPDCRPEFIRAFAALAQVATKAGTAGREIRIQAPLMQMSKADIVRAAIANGVDLSATISCYQPDRYGRACAQCDACRLRRDGFAAAGVPDSTRYRL